MISVNGLNKRVRTIKDVRDRNGEKYPDLNMNYYTNESVGLTSAELKIKLR